MRTLIATLLLLVSTSVFAIGYDKHNDNTDWEYEVTTAKWPDSKNVSGNPDGYIHRLTSEMPSTGASLQYMLEVYRKDTGAPSQASGWSLTIKFGDNLQASDIAGMGAGYRFGDKWYRLDQWKTVGRDVIIFMSVDNITSLRDGAAAYDVAEIEIEYKTKAEAEKGFDATWVTLTFNFKNAFNDRFAELSDDVTNLGSVNYLRNTAYYKDLPINQLPEGMKPTPSAMVEAAKRANVDLDAAYTMSVNELDKAMLDEQARVKAAEAEKKRKAAEQKRAVEKAKAELQKQEQQAKSDAYAKKMRNFDWPDSYCDRPSLPSLNANQRRRDRFNRDLGDWHDCMNNATHNDYDAIKSLVRSVDGNWSEAGGSIEWSVPNSCTDCRARVKELFGYVDQRADNRVAQQVEFSDGIDRWNSRDQSKQQSEAMWDSINDALDRSAREMEEMNRQRQEIWNNQIYITPGYY